MLISSSFRGGNINYGRFGASIQSVYLHHRVENEIDFLDGKGKTGWLMEEIPLVCGQLQDH